MKRKVVTAAAVVTLGVGLVGVTRDQLVTSAQQPAVGPNVTVTPVRQMPGPPLPTLTSAEEARARTIFMQDARAQQLLGAEVLQAFTIKKIGVWHTTNTLEKLGASMIVSLPAPLTVVGAWPSYVYDETERTSPPYRELTEQFTAVNVRELIVLIDLQRSKVISITPAPRTQVILPPDATPRSAPSGK